VTKYAAVGEVENVTYVPDSEAFEPTLKNVDERNANNLMMARSSGTLTRAGLNLGPLGDLIDRPSCI
jgi:hypothetical protein